MAEDATVGNPAMAGMSSAIADIGVIEKWILKLLLKSHLLEILNITSQLINPSPSHDGQFSISNWFAHIPSECPM